MRYSYRSTNDVCMYINFIYYISINYINIHVCVYKHYIYKYLHI